MEIDLDTYLKAAGGKPTEAKKAELKTLNEMLRARGRQRVVEGVIVEVADHDYDQVGYVAVKNNDGKEEYWGLDSFPCTDEELAVLRNLNAKVRLTIKLEILDS